MIDINKNNIYNNFQRIGAISNAHVGQDFENIAKEYFDDNRYRVLPNYSIAIGFTTIKKTHVFDLGGVDNKGNEVVIECKSHKWTSGANVPSAKMTTWNEVMLFFSLLPEETTKILFVLKDYSEKRRETLAEYYIRTHRNLIPNEVKIMECDSETHLVSQVI